MPATKLNICRRDKLININRPIGDTLTLSARASKALRSVGLEYLWELVSCTDTQLLRIPNMGRLSLNEIKDNLAIHGLYPGMENVSLLRAPHTLTDERFIVEDCT